MDLQSQSKYKCLFSKTCLKRSLKNTSKYVFKTANRLMQVRKIAEVEHSVMLLACTKLLLVFNTFVFVLFLSFVAFLEWPLKTDFTLFELA